MEKKILVDKQGYQQMLDELEELKARFNEASRLRYEAAKYGTGHDSDDNFDLEQAKREQELLRYEILKRQNLISRAIIVEKSEEENIIDLDSYVDVSIELDGDVDDFIVHLVAHSETIKENDKFVTVTVNSPLGESIYKKKCNELSSYKVENNIFNVTIKNILNALEVEELLNPIVKKLDKNN